MDPGAVRAEEASLGKCTAALQGFTDFAACLALILNDS